MTDVPDPGHTADRIVAANRYMTLATADGSGRPWASPLWFATDDRRDFYWVSKPGSRHSQNIATRREVAIVIFDSTVEVGSAAAVFVEAVAEQPAGDDAARGIEIFNQVSRGQGLGEWGLEDVVPPARHRLYRARAVERWILGPRDERIPVTT